MAEDTTLEAGGDIDGLWIVFPRSRRRNQLNKSISFAMRLRCGRFENDGMGILFQNGRFYKW
jgi:hypothetical protein